VCFRQTGGLLVYSLGGPTPKGANGHDRGVPGEYWRVPYTHNPSGWRQLEFPSPNGGCLATPVLTNTTGSAVFTNVTSGTTVAFHFSAPTGTTLVGNCAEWIAERPGINGSISKLADYDTVEFSNTSAHTTSGVVLKGGSGDNMNTTDANGNVISLGILENSDLVRCNYTGPSLRAYHKRGLETPIDLGVTNPSQFVFLLAPNLDLFAIEMNGTETRETEVHVFQAAHNYQSRGIETSTGLGQTTPTQFVFRLAPNLDLYAIEMNGTATGKIDAQVFKL
jgi:Peptidase A4 family